MKDINKLIKKHKTIKNICFLRIKDNEIQNQGLIQELNKDGGNGFYFDFLMGEESDSFAFSSIFTDSCIFFNTDYEMRCFYNNFTEKPFNLSEYIGKCY